MQKKKGAEEYLKDIEDGKSIMTVKKWENELASQNGTKNILRWIDNEEQDLMDMDREAETRKMAAEGKMDEPDR